MKKNNIEFFKSQSRSVASGCVEWQGNLNHAGYGSMRSEYGQTAHRFAYGIVHGPIPKGIQICHKCDNPKCVNIEHLFAGTNQDNVNDKVAKGRHPKGENTATTKLKDATVAEIRSRYVWGSKDFGTRGLARIYNVSHRLIWSIVANKDRIPE